MSKELSLFRVELEQCFEDGSFVKLSLGNYQGDDAQLKNIFVKPIVIKGKPFWSFTYRNKTNDMVKNFALHEALNQIEALLQSGFKIATLFAINSEVIFEYNKKGVARIRKRAIQLPKANLQHNKQKQRLINKETNNFLYHLGITDEHGDVFDKGQDKYKQINHYVELLSPMLAKWDKTIPLKVADMGSGKGYLTFAIYDYLTKQLKLQAEVTGVEFRKDLVDYCNLVAEKSGFVNLDFREGTIADYPITAINLLIALHACDTATDDAIAKGIKANAEMIVVAPCCHKQIRKAIEKDGVKNQVSFITKHGIFLERQAEMVTDGIRALILEYFGYKTKVLEFISNAHTPKNVMIVAERNKGQGAKTNEALLAKIADAKAFFGIETHYLETQVF